jgi:hypothetical protein
VPGDVISNVPIAQLMHRRFALGSGARLPSNRRAPRVVAMLCRLAAIESVAEMIRKLAKG